MMPVRIAIVDDDPGFRRLAVVLLRTRGFEVVSTDGDLSTARESFERLRPDAALVDCHLPDGDGLQFARTLYLADIRSSIVLTSTDVDALPDDAHNGSHVRAFVPKDQLGTADLHALFGTAG